MWDVKRDAIINCPYVTLNIFMSRSNHTTEHRKSHGVASFSDVAKNIAASWKTIDSETKTWCTEVEKVSSFS